MIAGTIALWTAAALLSLVARGIRPGACRDGWRLGRRNLVRYLPLLGLVFTISALLQVLLPPDLIRAWLGDASGWRGLVIGSVAGALIPSGPYVTFPIVISLYGAGAGAGTAVAMLTGWSLWNVGKLPYEASLLGPKFTLLRYALTLPFPLLAGFLARVFTG
jgi:uncharacterized membrane protein YraQ (UPF0718 family)